MLLTVFRVEYLSQRGKHTVSHLLCLATRPNLAKKVVYERPLDLFQHLVRASRLHIQVNSVFLLLVVTIAIPISIINGIMLVPMCADVIIFEMRCEVDSSNLFANVLISILELHHHFF